MDSFETYLKKTGEVGFIQRIIGDIVYADGLPGAKPQEVVVFESGGFGQIMSLSRDTIQILTFSKHRLSTGLKVARTNSTLSVPVGRQLLGNIVNPFGEAFDSHKRISVPSEKRDVNGKLQGIAKRKTVKRNLETGVSLVDIMIPIGQGQRQLVIGDRKTGKSTFLLQTMLSYAKQGNICIYAAIGKKKIDIKRIEEFLQKNKVMDKVVMVASTPQDAPGLIFLTPYSAMTIAEYFRDQGSDVLLIFDDLSTHAKFYREISLLARRFPGRNSYPADMFYKHARLLERAGNFDVNGREVSITAIPVADALQGDLSGFIQTNIMSMTDGHIFFDNSLFYEGRRPAINKFLSVTRVGFQTQTNLKRSIARELFSTLTLYNKMQNFVHFGAELSQTTRQTLSTGLKITELFDQGIGDLIPVNVQMVLLALFWGQKIQVEDTTKMYSMRSKLVSLYQSDPAYRKAIDEMVAASNTYNELLATVEDKLKTIIP